MVSSSRVYSRLCLIGKNDVFGWGLRHSMPIQIPSYIFTASKHDRLRKQATLGTSVPTITWPERDKIPPLRV